MREQRSTNTLPLSNDKIICSALKVSFLLSANIIKVNLPSVLNIFSIFYILKTQEFLAAAR